MTGMSLRGIMSAVRNANKKLPVLSLNGGVGRGLNEVAGLGRVLRKMNGGSG